MDLQIVNHDNGTVSLAAFAEGIETSVTLPQSQLATEAVGWLMQLDERTRWLAVESALLERQEQAAFWDLERRYREHFGEEPTAPQDEA